MPQAGEADGKAPMSVSALISAAHHFRHQALNLAN
jgi:hypothetical protein